MGVSLEARKEFTDKVKPLKEKIAEILKDEKNCLGAISGKDERTVVDGKIKLSEMMIHLATVQICINSVSVEMLEVKNNDILNDARKSIYKAIIYIEEVVTNTVDCPYSELETKQNKIEHYTVDRRYELVKKLGLVIDMLVDAFGDNSKWKESFVELRGRFVVVAKNMLDMRTGYKAYFEPGEPFHEETVLYVRLVRSLLDKSATEYRDRYELASRRIDDMRTAVNLLIAARRIAMVLGDSEGSEEIRKKALVWKTKMETDQKAGISK